MNVGLLKLYTWIKQYMLIKFRPKIGIKGIKGIKTQTHQYNCSRLISGSYLWVDLHTNRWLTDIYKNNNIIIEYKLDSKISIIYDKRTYYNDCTEARRFYLICG